MIKKTLSSIALLICVTLFLTACSFLGFGGNNPGKITPTETYITISFKLNEETTYSDIVVLTESQPALPDEPTKSDYIFDGWYLETENFETKFDANYITNNPLTKDLTVYASWAELNDESIMKLLDTSFDKSNEEFEKATSIKINYGLDIDFSYFGFSEDFFGSKGVVAVKTENDNSKLNVADAISSKFKNEIDIEKDYDEEEEEVKVIKKSPWDDDYLKGYDKPKPRHPHSRPKEVEDNTMKLNKEKKDTLVVSESDYADFIKWQKQLNKKQSEDEM